MEFFGVGLGEILLIAVVALVVLGPDRLPDAMRSVGRVVYEFRKAMEPARAAWDDVQREIVNTMDIAGGSTGAKAASSTGKPSGNPWDLHPVAQGLTDEERVRFFTTGELPDWRLKELEALDKESRNGNHASSALPPGDLPELDYPAPHEPLTYQQAPQPSETLEEVGYPEPGTATTGEEQQ